MGLGGEESEKGLWSSGVARVRIEPAAVDAGANECPVLEPARDERVHHVTLACRRCEVVAGW